MHSFSTNFFFFALHSKVTGGSSYNACFLKNQEWSENKDKPERIIYYNTCFEVQIITNGGL